MSLLLPRMPDFLFWVENVLLQHGSCRSCELISAPDCSYIYIYLATFIYIVHRHVIGKEHGTTNGSTNGTNHHFIPFPEW